MGSRTGSPTRAASPKRSPTKMAPKKKTPTKKKVVKNAAAHPTYKEMIMAAVVALKQRGGSSRQAITKYIAGHYKVGENYNVHLKIAIRRALASGMLVAAHNHAGTYRLSKAALTPAKPKKKKKVTAKKPAAKKAKKPKKKAAPKKKKAAPKKAKKAGTKKKTATKAKKPAKKTATKKKAPAKKVKRASAKKAKK